MRKFDTLCSALPCVPYPRQPSLALTGPCHTFKTTKRSVNDDLCGSPAFVVVGPRGGGRRSWSGPEKTRTVGIPGHSGGGVQGWGQNGSDKTIGGDGRGPGGGESDKKSSTGEHCSVGGPGRGGIGSVRAAKCVECRVGSGGGGQVLSPLNVQELLQGPGGGGLLFRPTLPPTVAADWVLLKSSGAHTMH